MSSLSMRWSLAAMTAVVCAGGCSRSIVSSTPDAAATSPAGMCTGSGVVSVTLKGDGLDTMMSGLLTDDAQAVPPTVTLSRVRDETGAPVSGAPIPIGGPGQGGAAGNLRWQSRREMTFQIDSGLLAAGVYDVTVTVAGGKQSVLAGGLVLLPPPRIDGVAAWKNGPLVPSCANGGRVVLAGDFFVQFGLVEPPDGGVGDGGDAGDAGADDDGGADALVNPFGVPEGPRALVTVLRDGSPVEMSAELVQVSCSRIAGAGEWARCKQLIVNVPAGQPASSTFRVAVVNPAPFTCAGEPVSFSCGAP